MSIVVVPHDPAWAGQYAEVEAVLLEHLAGLDAVVEHVGSTSVPGLAAKPVLDIDVVVRVEDVGAAIAALERGGYAHRGDLGVPGREAFTSAPGGPARHVYVCVEGGTALRNHLAVREVLRSDPELRRAYGELKLGLAEEDLDIDAYVERKSPLLQQVLARADLSVTERAAIGEVNRAPR